MTEISKSVIYIGADDKDLDLFESQYIVPEGISYNSYLILDEKVAVMDTIDRRKTDEWFDKLDKALGGRTPDYLVISHLEPDHAANIKAAAEKYPQMKLVGNKKTFAMLPQFFDMSLDGRTVEVGEGDELSLGEHTLKFIMAPMVHWPEVMMTYETSEKILFSADAFGKFGALDVDADWDCEARRYYFNIVGKYGAQVQAVLKKAAALDIKTICPLHGPVLSEKLEYYINKYDIWSSYRPEDEGIFIAYASIHGNTKAAAEQLKEILDKKGAQKTVITDLSRCDIAEAVEDAFRYSKLVVAASTYDGGVFPPMEEFLAHLKSKGYKNRKAAVMENGSWGPVAGRKMREALEQMNGVEICDKSVTIKSTVKPETVTAMEEMADAFIAM
ncbi:MAG TPA: FprA family A-type flavoprotein [Candidatus Ornithomonoglobus intestinigallinarum]|uniref:FprA family A-type flavoprotein n=1 Tax=Candidatus Ornithomonoglobus intestinigallinarum TaxID=2840894 RepID=A0A9D1KR01_9FIRM|nr:FprA family A-type flavoprotein [Candidatus Ornithomonoglobus intestinigallinarum]